METEALIKQDWDDLVFENRNKDYGAYTLRRDYPGHVLEGTVAAISFIVLAFFAPVIIARFTPASAVKISKGETIAPTRTPEIIADKKSVPLLPKKVQLKSTYVIPMLTNADVDQTDVQAPVEAAVERGTSDGTGTSVPDDIQPATESVSIVSTTDESAPVSYVEHMPEFTGGLPAMLKFIEKHIKYPHSARALGLEGTVFVQFVIGRDGVISDVDVIRGLSQDCDREAARVVAMFPKWKPGIQGDHPVAVKMVLPIKFRLDKL